MIFKNTPKMKVPEGSGKGSSDWFLSAARLSFCFQGFVKLYKRLMEVSKLCVRALSGFCRGFKRKP